MMSDMREVVEKTVEEYNRYRGSVARAEIVEIREGEVVLRISGTLCHTCGFRDYLEDFVYEMERVTEDYRASLEGYEEGSTDEFLVKYRIEKVKR